MQVVEERFFLYYLRYFEEIKFERVLFFKNLTRSLPNMGRLVATRRGQQNFVVRTFDRAKTHAIHTARMTVIGADAVARIQRPNSGRLV